MQVGGNENHVLYPRRLNKFLSAAQKQICSAQEIINLLSVWNTEQPVSDLLFSGQRGCRPKSLQDLWKLLQKTNLLLTTGPTQYVRLQDRHLHSVSLLLTIDFGKYDRTFSFKIKTGYDIRQHQKRHNILFHYDRRLQGKTFLYWNDIKH